MSKDSNRYVLLVEDDPTDWSVFVSLLEQIGLTVIQNESKLPVASFKEAVNILRTAGKNIEFALLDINLPGEKTGADIAEYILSNKYPIKFIYTTAHLNDSNIKSIANVGQQYGTIVKPNMIVDKKIALFQLRQLLIPSNPLLTHKMETLRLNVQELRLVENRAKQIFPRYEMHYPMQVIPVNEIGFICTGKGDIYHVPDNYCVIVFTDLKTGYFIRQSLEDLMEHKLDDRFIRINKNTCVNITHSTLRTPSLKNSHIVICGLEFKITDRYRSDYENRLIAYGLI